MKRFALLLTVLLPFSALAQTSLSSWQMQRQGDTRSYDVTVPATVAGALNEAGAFGPNVLDEARYKTIDTRQFDDPWVFMTRFNLEKGLRHILRFEGLNYAADIRFNGKLIASADTTYGTFCVREFDITSLAKKRYNTLEVTVHKAPEACLNTGFADWNPRPVDENMGIIRPVLLISTPDVQIQDIYVKPIVNPKNLKEASFEVLTTLVNRSAKPVTHTLEGKYDDGGSFSEKVTLAGGETRLVKHIEKVANPRIWWSCDMGTPEMYTLSVRVGDQQRSVRFGLRDISSEVDVYGHRLFYLNGRPVFLKSAGWSDDIFLQDTPEKLRTQALFVKDMGLNCIRFENIWGKDDTIYDICDELGLLTFVGWSCQWEWKSYCGIPETKGFGCINDPQTEALAIRYFHDQVIRLRNHPSLIAWLTGSDRIPNERLEKEYLKIYSKEDYRPYVCSAKGLTSLAGPSGTKMEGPYEYVGPDYWWVDTQNGGAYGFNTETGVGMNIPQAESVRRIVGEDHTWPLDGNWDFHCTASTTAMNSPKMAVDVMTAMYGAPTGFGDFMHKAHVLDYDGTRAMYEAFRCNIPRTTGIVQWMLNSAWPSLYWQLYDWYLVPTAGYYGTKKACAPYQLVFNYKDNSVWAVNDSAPEKELKAVMKIYSPDGTTRTERREAEFSLKAREPKMVFDGIEGPCFVYLELRRGDHTVADNFYCIPEKNNTYKWNKANWYLTPITEYSDLSFVSALAPADVKMKAEPRTGSYKITLENESDVIAYQISVKALSGRGELLPGIIWTDNFVTILPHESKVVRCTIPEGTPTPYFDMDGWNLPAKAEDPLDRAQSKYATYSFSQDDVYRVDTPYETVTVKQPKGKKVKNVIMMIGDGMGFEHISCGWVTNGGSLNMEQMPYFGSSRTTAADKLITDSCAGGTALACGEKTNYGYIGIDTDAKPMVSALHVAQSKGMKTGVTVTCRINDATPADFCVHSPSRKLEEEIAAQYVDASVDFISGGGLHFWTSRESDSRNLVEEMKAKGYTFVDKLEDVKDASGSKFLGLFGEYDLDPVLERGDVLRTTTLKALEMLDNPKGFFLMIEGSQIDDWAHRNKVGYMCEELFDFDRTIGEVLKWAEQDGETLVVVTADHNTGGLTLLKGSVEDREVKVNFSTRGHHGLLVPVFAYGPQAEKFAGFHENADIGTLLKEIIAAKK